MWSDHSTHVHNAATSPHTCQWTQCSYIPSHLPVQTMQLHPLTPASANDAVTSPHTCQWTQCSYIPSHLPVETMQLHPLTPASAHNAVRSSHTCNNTVRLPHTLSHTCTQCRMRSANIAEFIMDYSPHAACGSDMIQLPDQIPLTVYMWWLPQFHKICIKK